MPTSRVPFNISGNALSVFVGSRHFAIDNTHRNFDTIKDLLRAGPVDTDELLRLIDIRAEIVAALAVYGDVQVGNDAVLYKGQPVHNHLTDRLLRLAKDGFDIAPWARFLDNVMRNPSKTAVDELYLWLEQSGMPITEDGKFLAYKKVRDDFLSFYDGKTNNSVGTILEMPRNAVDDNRDRTCSYGFHFCSHHYLPHYHGGRGKVIVVEIDPADVVSIPSDYANAKGRACKYKVIDVVAEADAPSSFTDPVYIGIDTIDDDEIPEFSGDLYPN